MTHLSDLSEGSFWKKNYSFYSNSSKLSNNKWPFDSTKWQVFYRPGHPLQYQRENAPAPPEGVEEFARRAAPAPSQPQPAACGLADPRLIVGSHRRKTGEDRRWAVGHHETLSGKIEQVFVVVVVADGADPFPGNTDFFGQPPDRPALGDRRGEDLDPDRLPVEGRGGLDDAAPGQPGGKLAGDAVTGLRGGRCRAPG